VLAAHIGRCHPGLLFLRDADDLFLVNLDRFIVRLLVDLNPGNWTV
jgi:hypothetical protein